MYMQQSYNLAIYNDLATYVQYVITKLSYCHQCCHSEAITIFRTISAGKLYYVVVLVLP